MVRNVSSTARLPERTSLRLLTLEATDLAHDVKLLKACEARTALAAREKSSDSEENISTAIKHQASQMLANRGGLQMKMENPIDWYCRVPRSSTTREPK